MVDSPKRIDHFAASRESSVDTRKVDPGLEYEKYRITPALVQTMKGLTSTPGKATHAAGLDDLIRHHAAMSYRAGQDDMIRMLESLMTTQEEQT